jgi:hypothetical protein
VIAKAADSDSKQPIISLGKPKGQDLDERISSGEFTDYGSTKEKLTRPVRKVLAQDPVGIGE